MTIGTAMLVGLGFLIALLFAAVVAPAYRRRTVRLTTDALKRSLPLTEAEIRADKDRLRAEHAIRIHNLETKLDSVSQNSTRQKIEVNRRDARISELEGIVGGQKTQIEELENARRVLEQTVTDRLPRIEGRLNDARKLLFQRDGEIATLAETAQKQARAIAEALQINVQQSGEIDRLTIALSTRAARGQDTAGDDRFDGEIALRSEIEALRTKGREQSALIANLQDVMARPRIEPSAKFALPDGGVNRGARDGQSEGEIARLKSELADAQADLAMLRSKAGHDVGAADASGRRLLQAELHRAQASNGELSAEIGRLKSVLAAIEAGDSDKRSKDSPIAAKAKIASLEAQVREQTATIQSLRAETAAVNERLARQAAHYMEEMKRSGAGTVPTAVEPRRPRAEPVKRSLFDRISDPRVVQLSARVTANPRDSSLAVADDALDGHQASNVAPLFALTDQAPAPDQNSTAPAFAATDEPTGPSGVAKPAGAPRRPRLLERITSIDKPGSN